MHHIAVTPADIVVANIHDTISHRYSRESELAAFFKSKCADRSNGPNGQYTNYLLGKEEKAYNLNTRYVPELYQKLATIQNLSEIIIAELPSDNSALVIGIDIKFKPAALSASNLDALMQHPQLLSNVAKFNRRILIELLNINFGLSTDIVLPAESQEFTWYCYRVLNKIICVFPSIRIMPANRYEVINSLSKQKLLNVFNLDIVEQVAMNMDSYTDLFYIPKTRGDYTKFLFSYKTAFQQDLTYNEIAMDVVEGTTMPAINHMMSLHFEPIDAFIIQNSDGIIDHNLSDVLNTLEHSIERSTIGDMAYELPYILATLKIMPVDRWIDSDLLYEMCYVSGNFNGDPNVKWNNLGHWISLHLTDNKTAWDEFKQTYPNKPKKTQCVKLIINKVINTAKTDNIQLFNEMQQDHMVNRVLDFLDEYDRVPDMIPGMLLAMYHMGEVIVDVSDMRSSNNTWFIFFNKHMSPYSDDPRLYKWVEYANNAIEHKYRSFISMLMSIYTIVLHKINDQLGDIKQQINMYYDANTNKKPVIPPQLVASKKAFDVKIKTLTNAKLALLQLTQLTKISISASICLMDYNFSKLLDKDPSILGVGNGVINLFHRNSNNMIEPRFIGGYHDHLITKYTKTKYAPYNPECPIVQHVIQIIKTVIVEDDAFYKFMLYFASALYGGSKITQFFIMKAGGANGKTTLARLISKTFGEQYSVSARTSLITGVGESASSANSAFVSLKDGLVLFFSEFKSGDRLNDMLMKKIISQEDQSGRKLYKDEINFEIYGVPIILINVALNIDSTDHGTWRRLSIYECKSKFVNSPNPDVPNEKQKDSKILDVHVQDGKYHTAFLSILLHYFAILHNEYNGDITLVPSKTIDEETHAFRLGQDKLLQFKIRYLVPCENKTAAISLSVVAESFSAFLLKQSVKATPFQVYDDLLNSELGKDITTVKDVKYLMNYTLRTEDEVRQHENAPITIGEPTDVVLSEAPHV